MKLFLSAALFSLFAFADVYMPAPEGGSYANTIGLKDDQGFLFFDIKYDKKVFLCRVGCGAFTSHLPYTQRKACVRNGKGLPIVADIQKLQKTEAGKALYKLAKGGKVDKLKKFIQLKAQTKAFLDAQADEDFSFLKSASDCALYQKTIGYTSKKLTPKACDIRYSTKADREDSWGPWKKVNFAANQKESQRFKAIRVYIRLSYSVFACGSSFNLNAGRELGGDSHYVTGPSNNVRIIRQSYSAKEYPKD